MNRISPESSWDDAEALVEVGKKWIQLSGDLVKYQEDKKNVEDNPDYQDILATLGNMVEGLQKDDTQKDLEDMQKDDGYKNAEEAYNRAIDLLKMRLIDHPEEENEIRTMTHKCHSNAVLCNQKLIELEDDYLELRHLRERVITHCNLVLSERNVEPKIHSKCLFRRAKMLFDMERPLEAWEDFYSWSKLYHPKVSDDPPPSADFGRKNNFTGKREHARQSLDDYMRRIAEDMVRNPEKYREAPRPRGSTTPCLGA